MTWIPAIIIANGERATLQWTLSHGVSNHRLLNWLCVQANKKENIEAQCYWVFANVIQASPQNVPTMQTSFPCHQARLNEVVSAWMTEWTWAAGNISIPQMCSIARNANNLPVCRPAKMSRVCRSCYGASVVCNRLDGTAVRNPPGLLVLGRYIYIPNEPPGYLTRTTCTGIWNIKNLHFLHDILMFLKLNRFSDFNT